MTPITEIARGKVNLTLTVLGRRSDGYHEIDSLVVFVEAADRLTFWRGEPTDIEIAGRFGNWIAGENLLDRTFTCLRAVAPQLTLGRVHLEKNLPVAAGLGGGSADAAALLRAVRRANPICASAVDWKALAAKLGSDVPVCLSSQAALIRGVGDRIEPVRSLPPLSIVLINPLIGVPPAKTREVYQALAAPPLSASLSTSCPKFGDPTSGDLRRTLLERGNHLELAAERLMPAIIEVKAALTSQSRCWLTRMSGSGPTCFGLFETNKDAKSAAARICKAYPRWWVLASEVH
jgi:4-diphosphocytidyl-2-C-methyl-D-erythritol kinase